MEEFFSFFIISIFVQIIYWGIFYYTGWVLTPIISLAQWRAASITKNSEGKRKAGWGLIKEGNKTLLGVSSVCLLGFVFWIGILIFLSSINS